VEGVDWTEVHADLDAQDDLPKRSDAILQRIESTSPVQILEPG
jgi:hypothetical protein